MIFTEAGFLVFFAVAFALNWAIRGHLARKTWLLLCSYFFYGMWNWDLLWLIAASTVIDYVVALGLGRTEAPGRRRLWLGLSLLVNIGLLATFKYYDFFVTSGAGLLQDLGFDVQARTLGLVLPVGISFYTFQTLSYSIDVYRRRMEPQRSLLDFALFVSFFPQLVAGPIVRAVDFVPQLASRRRWVDVDVRACLTLFLLGFIKKACVSDNIAPVIDQVFSEPAAFGVGARSLAGVLWSIQVYCDFSGYSDMAIATAGLLGYRLALNFNFPLTAASMSELWSRWHISLLTWFRDYLYIPLGGSRHGTLATYRNVFLVLLFSGLWHGASWVYVVWGALHGVILIVERMLGADGPHARASFWPRWLFTQVVWVLTLAIFRSPTLASSVTFLSGLGAGDVAATSVIPHAGLWWSLALGFYAVHWGMRARMLERLPSLPGWAWAVCYGAVLGVVIPFVQTHYQPFVYFQF